MKHQGSTQQKQVNEDLQTYRVESSEHSRLHFSYERETIYLDAIRKGNPEEAMQILQEIFKLHKVTDNPSAETYFEQTSGSIGVMSRDQLKNTEYSAVALIAITTRAAIEGGLDPFLAYDISDLYLQKLSKAGTVEQYLSIMLDGVSTFLKEVKKVHSRELNSIHTLHARQYIGRNLNKPLSLEIIAEAIGLSPSYLSAIFKQVEGIGIKQYITLQRIDAAKNLLIYSEEEIGTIAAYVGFCSQSHFGKVFKETTGMTPNQYRHNQQQ